MLVRLRKERAARRTAPTFQTLIDFYAFDDQAEAIEAETGVFDGGADLKDLLFGEIDFLRADVVVELRQIDEALEVGGEHGGGTFAGGFLERDRVGFRAVVGGFDEVF